MEGTGPLSRRLIHGPAVMLAPIQHSCEPVRSSLWGSLQGDNSVRKGRGRPDLGEVATGRCSRVAVALFHPATCLRAFSDNVSACCHE